MSASTWDVVVIGGGPAGALAAARLARRGRRVLVVDKQSHPRPKVCGGCLGAVGLAALEEADLSLESLDVPSTPLTSVRVRAGGASAELPLQGRQAIDRRVLDTRLLAAARDAGAEVREQTEARPIEGGVQLRPARSSADWQSIEAKLVLIAAGLGSQRLLGSAGQSITSRTRRLGAGTIVPDPGVDLPDEQVLMACGGGEGYVGVARLADGSLDVAAAFRPTAAEGGRSALGQAAERILDRAGMPISGLGLAEWRATPTLTQRPQRVGAGATLLIGDASGYVEPFTGEGIGWALRSALEVEPIAEAFLAGKVDDPGRLWNRRHAATIGQWQRRCRWVCGAIGDRRVTTLLVRTLALAPWIARPVLGRIDPRTTPPPNFAPGQ